MNVNKPKTKKEFAPSVPFWPAKSGNGFTTAINEEVLGELQKAKLGGRLLLTEVASDNEKAPAYRVTIFAPNPDAAATRPTAESGDSL